MPALVPTDHSCTVTWLGRSTARDAPRVRAEAADHLVLDFAGVEGEAHAGLTRPSCSRVTQQHPRGTEIRNVRQLSIVSEEEMALIAAELDLERLDPLWLGATVVVEGIADFSHLPPSSRLQAASGLTLCIDMTNEPCNIVSVTIEEARPGHGKRFRAAAKGRRGVTAWVERPGRLDLGSELRLHVPRQRAWAPGGAA